MDLHYTVPYKQITTILDAVPTMRLKLSNIILVLAI
jgi:hypothetical protein